MHDESILITTYKRLYGDKMDAMNQPVIQYYQHDYESVRQFFETKGVLTQVEKFNLWLMYLITDRLVEAKSLLEKCLSEDKDFLHQPSSIIHEAYKLDQALKAEIENLLVGD